MITLDQYGAQILGRTVWGESRGTPALWVPITWSIKNRLALPKKYGATVQEVCLRPAQYDCWMPGAHNSRSWANWLATITASGDVFEKLAEAVGQAWDDTGTDPVGGATHYYADDIGEPEWAKASVFTVKIANTLFFKGVP